MSAVPTNNYDRYCLFIYNTEQLTSVELQQAAPNGVSIQMVPKGTILTAADRNNHLHLDFELRQDAVMIELGPGVALDDDTWQVVVNCMHASRRNPRRMPLSLKNNNKVVLRP